MYPRISAFSQISFLSRNSHTVCSPIMTGNLILHIPNFVFSMFPLIPLPPATAKYLMHGIRAQNHNSFQTWNFTGDGPLGNSTSHQFYRTNLFPRAKSSPSQKSQLDPDLQSWGKAFTMDPGEEPPPALLGKGWWIQWAPTCDAPWLPPLPTFPVSFSAHFFPL